MILLLGSSCNDDEKKLLSDETFETLYGDVLFLGELYRGDSTLIRQGVDSLLHVHGTDTATFFTTAEHYAHDREKMDQLYKVTIERFEQLSNRNDSSGTVTENTVHPMD